MTNADKIRHLSDENLALFIVSNALVNAMCADGVFDIDTVEESVSRKIANHEVDQYIADALNFLKQESE